jgi:hypothetical protein
VTGFLRLVGIFNASVWFGAAVLFICALHPVPFSDDMKQLLGSRNYPYFSEAIAQLLTARYYPLQLVCAFVAWLHLLAERLYLGKTPSTLRLGLLTGLFAISLAGATFIHPKLKEANTIRYGVNTSAQARQAAAERFIFWQRIFQMTNVLALGGIAVYLWRVANSPEPARFTSSSKFRS